MRRSIQHRPRLCHGRAGSCARARSSRQAAGEAAQRSRREEGGRAVLQARAQPASQPRPLLLLLLLRTSCSPGMARAVTRPQARRGATRAGARADRRPAGGASEFIILTADAEADRRQQASGCRSGGTLPPHQVPPLGRARLLASQARRGSAAGAAGHAAHRPSVLRSNRRRNSGPVSRRAPPTTMEPPPPQQPLTIHLWACPRSLSTSLMYSFAQVG